MPLRNLGADEPECQLNPGCTAPTSRLIKPRTRDVAQAENARRSAKVRPRLLKRSLYDLAAILVLLLRRGDGSPHCATEKIGNTSDRRHG